MRGVLAVCGAVVVVMLAIGVAEKSLVTPGDPMVASVAADQAHVPAKMPDAPTGSALWLRRS